MLTRSTIVIFFLSLMISACTREIDCANGGIEPAFIGYSTSDIDTLVFRRFKANDNFQTLVDTFQVVYGWTGLYNTSHDTTSVWPREYEAGLRAGYDWQIFIPATNKLVFVSDIEGEKKTMKCTRGIFSLDSRCTCFNKVFSAKEDNLPISFPNSDTSRATIYIRK